MSVLGRRLVFWAQLVTTWTLAFVLFGFLRNFGWPKASGFDPSYSNSFGLHLALGLVVGTVYFLIELLMKRRIFRRLSFGRWAGLKLIMHFLLALGLFSLAVLLYPVFGGEVRVGLTFQEVLFSRLLLVALVYFSVISLAITLFTLMNQKLGPGILPNMLRGKYHHPRTEERIFLFIDLRSSTTIAEQLGHVRFSRLIQDCFADVTDAVTRYRAEIYQYVGDEVILCWTSAAGLRDNNCVEAYFHFMRTLDNHAAHYEREYGLQPVFKAGAHLGETTVAEVGIIKRELAYHGDVLNTAARIQSKCNELGELLLISPALHEALPLGDDYTAQTFAPVKLVGKADAMPVIGLRRRRPHGVAPTLL
ncbi:hypothetical protein LEM8419_03334 [Neolewinella maritima]|uniref:Guanylate cyclase domain-containing protein n=1 Tax=Neolewinella maritima TaxID=1383882 RepID=A0ABM9B4Z0_9BACT|nr:adenylate/guanylate cyclase domain-containing protein [Neolewinella maritima]CAH1002455.1 hypothetical protein LEM8419_03334 [Neolewinella maritima]